MPTCPGPLMVDSACLLVFSPPRALGSCVSIHPNLRAPTYCPQDFTPAPKHRTMTLSSLFACDRRGDHTAHVKRQPRWVVTPDSTHFLQCARRCDIYIEVPSQRHQAYNHRLIDICVMTADTETIEITDLDTLDTLTRGPGENLPWAGFAHMQPHVHKISVTLRLPLEFYRALEADEDDLLAIASRHTGTVAAACRTWARVWPAVCQMPQLRNLNIWMDHDDPSSWSVVGEQAVVSRRLMDVLAQHLDSSTSPPHGCADPIFLYYGSLRTYGNPIQVNSPDVSTKMRKQTD